MSRIVALSDLQSPTFEHMRRERAIAKARSDASDRLRNARRLQLWFDARGLDPEVFFGGNPPTEYRRSL